MKRCLTAVSSVVLLSCVSPVMADQQKSPWIVKGSGDIFSIESSVDGYFGMNAWPGNTKVEGELTGGTFTLGKVFRTNTPTMLSADISLRSGDLDSVYTSNVQKYDLDTTRDDIESTLTYQWLGKRWQPYVSLGYWGIEYEVKPDRYFNDITVDSTCLNLGLGLGIKVGDLDMGSSGSLQFSAKAGADMIYASATVKTKNNTTGMTYTPIDDNTLDYRWKLTALANYSLPVKSKPTSLFLEGGYQSQSMEFDNKNKSLGEFQLEWDGYYARLGLAIQL